MGQPYDASTKWLIQHHADSILKLVGLGEVESWTALPGELVQSRQLPDGLLEVTYRGRAEKSLVLLEINTYPDNRVASELLDDLLLTYLNRRQVPDLITILLRPKGHVTVPDRITVSSPDGGSEISARWKVVSLWDLDARPFLPNPGPGLAPWLTLARSAEPVNTFLRSLRESIDTVGDAGERANLLAISQILSGLRYDYDTLKALFGQEGAMIESPFLIERDRRMKLASYRELIAKLLGEKFGAVPSDITNAISQVNGADELLSLGTRIVGVQTLDEFRSALPK